MTRCCIGQDFFFERLDRAGDLADLSSCDGAGAINHERVLGWVEDGGFDSVLGGAGVQDGIDFAVQVFKDVIRGGGADMAEDVCAGGGYWNAGLAYELEGDGMGRHSDPDKMPAGGNNVGNGGAARQEECERAGPEGAYEVCGSWRHVRHQLLEHWVLAQRTGDVHNDGVPGGTLLGCEDAGDSVRVERVGAQAVDGLCGQGNEAA